MSGHKVPTYVSSGLYNKESAQKVAQHLETQFEIEITHRWFDVGEVPLGSYAEVSASELKGVARADLFVALLPGRLGTTAEIGASLMRAELLPATRIILWAEDENVYDQGFCGIPYSCIFWHHPYVRRVVGHDPVKSISDYLLRNNLAPVQE